MVIRIWVYDGVLASGVASAIDIFAAANALAAGKPQGAGPVFTWSVESLDGRPVRSASGQIIAVDRRIDDRAPSDAVLLTAPFVGDMDVFLQRRDEVLATVAALRQQYAMGAVMASYCTGNYLLAEAGLLDGRPATTHWSKAGDFSRRYPKVRLRAHEILAEQDGILSGGSVTSYLTLALRLVERFGGAELAGTTARTLLIETSRVSQASYASLINEHGHGDRLVARAQRLMEAAIQDSRPLSALAAELAVSERTLNRHFKQAVGMSPLEYLQTLRVEIAKQLLEDATIGVEEICLRVGYADMSTFRMLFRRKTGFSPREYKRQFQTALSREAG
jgi:transcriptional regulator GlxA family with amidase domain